MKLANSLFIFQFLGGSLGPKFQRIFIPNTFAGILHTKLEAAFPSTLF